MIKTRYFGLATICMVLISGCGGMLKGKEASDKAVTEFHKLYNDGKSAEIYSSTSSQFKSSSSEKDFVDLMAAVRRKLGKVASTVNAGFNIRAFADSTRVVLNQNTTFVQGSGQETFTFEMSGDNAMLVGYNISSKELITK